MVGILTGGIHGTQLFLQVRPHYRSYLQPQERHDTSLSGLMASGPAYVSASMAHVHMKRPRRSEFSNFLSMSLKDCKQLVLSHCTSRFTFSWTGFVLITEASAKEAFVSAEARLRLSHRPTVLLRHVLRMTSGPMLDVTFRLMQRQDKRGLRTIWLTAGKRTLLMRCGPVRHASVSDTLCPCRSIPSE